MRIATKNSWISAEQFGPEKAENLLLITGFIGVSSFWDFALPVISQKYRVTIFDQRGTGNSGPCDYPLTMQQMADDAELVMDIMNESPVHLVGHSAGSGISMILANRRPQSVQSISLLAGWTKADAWMQRVFDVRLNALNNSGPKAYASLTTLFMTPHADVAKLDADLTKAETIYAQKMPSYEEIEARTQAVLAFDSNDWANDVTCPTLVIGAQDDAMTPFYFSKELASSISQAELSSLKTGGHYFPRTRANEMTDLLLDFVNTHSIDQANLDNAIISRSTL